MPPILRKYGPGIGSVQKDANRGLAYQRFGVLGVMLTAFLTLGPFSAGHI